MQNEGTNDPNFKDANSGAVKNNLNALKEKRAMKEGVAKGVKVTVLICFILLVTAAVIVRSLYTKEKERQIAAMDNERHSYSMQLTERDSLINDWVLTFDQIEKDLNTIKEKEQLITVKSSNPEFSKDRKKQILEDISYINSLLDQNKKKIAALNAQLRNSGAAITGLQKKIAELDKSIIQREAELTELKTVLANKDFEIGQLNTRMTDLQVTITQKDEEINNKTGIIQRAYITSGTYKDLKERGLVSKEGGFLGLGKKEELLPQNFNDSSFVQINVNETKTIPVNSKSAKFVTAHPADSYELVRDTQKGIAYIEITNPEEFWRVSKYAVVEIVK